MSRLRAGRELRDRDAAGLVDVEGNLLHLADRVGDVVKVALGDVAAADLVGSDPGLFGDDAGRQLLGRHFEREEADNAAIGGLDRPVGARSRLVALGDVEGDVGGERRFPHAGTAGEDDEIGRLQAAHIAVEIRQPGGDAAERAFALIGAGGHVDGDLQGFGKALEAAVVTPRLGDLVEAPLRLLDLLARARNRPARHRRR